MTLDDTFQEISLFQEFIIHDIFFPCNKQVRISLQFDQSSLQYPCSVAFPLCISSYIIMMYIFFSVKITTVFPHKKLPDLPGSSCKTKTKEYWTCTLFKEGRKDYRILMRVHWLPRDVSLWKYCWFSKAKRYLTMTEWVPKLQCILVQK